MTKHEEGARGTHSEQREAKTHILLFQTVVCTIYIKKKNKILLIEEDKKKESKRGRKRERETVMHTLFCLLLGKKEHTSCGLCLEPRRSVLLW